MANVFHQLIVLGNGFDLNCGLASRFLDFFVPRMKLIESAAPLRGATLADYFSEHELTVWDLVLFQRKKALGPRGLNNWCDVESAIADFMLDEVYPVDEMGHDYKSVIFDDVCSYWSEVACGEGGDALVRREPSSFPPSPHSGYVDDDTKFIGIYLASRYPGGPRERKDVAAVLLKELHVLEQCFAEYLGGALAKQPAYTANSGDYLHKLLDFGLSEIGALAYRSTVLNFNYTSPGNPLSAICDSIDYRNVHGHLGGEIVFGIDGTGRLDDSTVARFTKTYRLLVLARNDFGIPIAYSGEDGKGPVGIETGMIKFYGHSLASADYSYFQSIFDLVNLYSSHVRLLFFYSDYSVTAREETYQRVLNLLSAYGETMDNEDHGKNLIHKLILEGRLSIVRL